jgi:hypothetical protein
LFHRRKHDFWFGEEMRHRDLGSGPLDSKGAGAASANRTVVSATNSQVQLKWTPGDNTATGYLVERKTLNGSYSTALNATGATASDNNIDAYTTYVYRVRATSTGGQSGPSNEVTAGPPPYGFNLAVAPPPNWKTQIVATDVGGQPFNYQSPSLAMNAGNVYLVFYHDYEGLRYVTGKETDDPKNWKSQVVPPLAGHEEVGRVTGLALDSAGVPGIAFVGGGDNGLAEGFWRPGNASSVLAMDNRGYQTDDPDVKLTFFGTQPRLIFSGVADDNYFADYSHTIWVTTSPDGGASWTKAVNRLHRNSRVVNSISRGSERVLNRIGDRDLGPYCTLLSAGDCGER